MRSADLIAQFEGYRDNPYWDVNAYRAGFGSDTTTLPDGRVVPIQQGMTVNRADSLRDLDRRIGSEFRPSVVNAIGQEAWSALGPGQQAVLDSLAYNYGAHAWDKGLRGVASAIRGGGDAVGAIRALASHNDGVNAKRRNREADIFGGGSPGILNNLSVSTKSQEAPMQGILGMIAPQAQEETRTFGQRLRDGARDGSLWDALAMGFNTMRGPEADAGLAASVQGRMDQRADGKRRNQTAEWLRQNGHDDLAAALDQGVVDGSSAIGMIMQRQQQQQEQNQTVAWLEANGRTDLAEAVRAGVLPVDQAFAQATAKADPWGSVKEVNGQLVAMGEGGPQVVGDYRTPDTQDPTADMQNYQFYANEEMKAGRAPVSFNEWDVSRRSAGATTVNVGGEGGRNAEFDKTLGKGRAEQYLTIQSAGREALRRGVQTDQLEAALAGSPSGFEAVAKQALGDWGVKTDGLDKLQAANALIEQLVPAQRPAGSGTMSDADIKMFRNSLPRLVNTPEGNRFIIEQARKIQTYDAQLGAIADQVVAGQITPDQGDQMMRELGNPMEGFAEKVSAIGGGPAPSAVPSVGEVRQGFRFKGGNPGDPNAWEQVQ